MMADLRKLIIPTEELNKATNPFHIEIKDVDLMKIDEAYPQLLIQEVMSEFNQQTNEYVVKQLVSLNIDKDVLLKQTQEIQRLNNKIEELQNQIPKWHYVKDGDLPKEKSEIYVSFKNSAGIHTGIATFYNNEFFYFSETELYGYVEEKYTEVIAWMELPSFEEVE